MPRYFTYQTALIALLIAFVCVPIPTGFGTKEITATPGLYHVLGCAYPRKIDAFDPYFASHSISIEPRRPLTHVVAVQDVDKEGRRRPNHTQEQQRNGVGAYSSGPNVIYETEHPVYPVLESIGREITQKVKPKAVVVISAHWQSSANVVEVNTSEHTDMIYDFYGFPSHYYEVQWPHVGSPALAKQILGLLSEAGIKAKGVARGPDHGVWAGFMVAFNPKTNPLAVPVVQVSLFDSEDADQHYKLGQALSVLRDEGVQIICTGMSVHNLRDFRRLHMMGDKTYNMPYTVAFDDALKTAAETAPEERQKAMKALLQTSDARKAHPTFDHILPIHVAAGAAGNDSGAQTWTMPEGCLAWGQFRFGKVGA
ncbi:hypothetical protein LTR10_004047 [Elasticomyces elasticus]|nr:hypothetical protein LTR10_004047 [Elasticomyces elasticus]KAK4977767.1 hypothetical protein LTR42_002140 [Elasticomyces elasticus]